MAVDAMRDGGHEQLTAYYEHHWQKPVRISIG
jgi:hypothetical protein